MDKDFFSSKYNDDESWVSVSDMMTGLMMIFLFIAIIYIQEVLNTYGEFEDVQAKICSELKNEFNDEQELWNMKICEGGLLVKFQNNENFAPDSKEITEKFQLVLSEFYPRFKKILWKYINDVDELRIEGHASSEARGKTAKEAYLYNTELSQGRSFNVMNYILGLEEISKNEEFLKWSYKNLTAHGMSSSDVVIVDNKEDRQASRRVEFRIRTKAEDKLIEFVKEFDGT
tara:strand:+ start:308 stop:997 length:690 start_codon:yes stop_codon:yes gene_type:complete